jgi:hypothetical protein
LCEPAEPVEQSLDSVLDGYRGMAVAAGQFLAGDALDFELNQETAFLGRKPSSLLAIVQELVKKDSGMKGFFGSHRVSVCGRIAVHISGFRTPRFVDCPAKCTSA